MKEELQGKLVEILTSIQTATGKASDFAMQQLPDIAQSYVTFGRAYYAVWMLAGLLIALVGIWCLMQTTKKEYWGELGPLPFLPLILGLVCLGVNMHAFLLTWFAPKVWLLKELANMVR